MKMKADRRKEKIATSESDFVCRDYLFCVGERDFFWIHNGYGLSAWVS